MDHIGGIMLNDVIRRGFISHGEVNSLIALVVSSVPMSEAGGRERLEEWEKKDGTKVGLLRLIGVYVAEGKTVFENKDAIERWFGYLRQEATRDYHLEVQKLQHAYLDRLRNLEIEKEEAYVFV